MQLGEYLSNTLQIFFLCLLSCFGFPFYYKFCLHAHNAFIYALHNIKTYKIIIYVLDNFTPTPSITQANARMERQNRWERLPAGKVGVTALSRAFILPIPKAIGILGSFFSPDGYRKKGTSTTSSPTNFPTVTPIPT